MNKIWQKKILHLGLGRFHRGHQAVYFQRLAEMEEQGWGIVSLSMRSPEARDDLRATGLKYPVIELSEKNVSMIWVESIREALDLNADREEVLSYFEQPEIEMISLTITEKGYGLDARGKLDLGHEQIKYDLAHPQEPKSAIGLLAAGFKRRSKVKAQPLTVLSCDNLRENGKMLEGALVSFLKALGDIETLNWVEENVSFPNSMVDRIVPSLTPEKIKDLESRFGLKENSHLIATEEFCQWVIEDNFKGQRPALDKVGVQFVSDVRPYEDMKLRLLNASHSFLAYTGSLKGYQYVHEAVSDANLQAKVELLMLREVMPLLQIPEDFNVLAYEESLISRFKNNQLPHQLKQIAMDGSQKLPQRILPSMMEAHLRNSSKEMLIFTISAWLNYCWKILNTNPLELNDPKRDQFLGLDRSDRFRWFHQMLETETFAALKGRDELKNIIVQKASTYSLEL